MVELSKKEAGFVRQLAELIGSALLTIMELPEPERSSKIIRVSRFFENLSNERNIEYVK